MLHVFFASFTIVFSFISFIIIGIVIPVWQFLTRADSVFGLYNLTIYFLEMNITLEEETGIEYGNYELKFINTDEASIELEKAANDALQYYYRLGEVGISLNFVEEQKDILVKICYELRRKRWQKARN